MGFFEGSHGQYALVSNLINARITDEDNALLLAPFVEEEFCLVLFCMHSDKPPGPDRLNPAFYKGFSDLCGREIYQASCHWL